MKSISSSSARINSRGLLERGAVVDVLREHEKLSDLEDNHRNQCFFDMLSDEMIMYDIMDYIGDLQTLLSIGAVCQRLRRLICNENISG